MEIDNSKVSKPCFICEFSKHHLYVNDKVIPMDQILQCAIFDYAKHKKEHILGTNAELYCWKQFAKSVSCLTKDEYKHLLEFIGFPKSFIGD